MIVIEQMMAKMAQLPDLGDWITPAGYLKSQKTTSKYIAICAVIADLKQEAYSRMTKAMPDYPHKSEALSRLAWLKHNEKVLEMLLNVTKAGIKKMENPESQSNNSAS